MRADLFLYNLGYVKSRQKAKNLIEGGNVKINSIVIKKPSFEINEAVENIVEITDDCPYVSRGGLKLAKMLDVLKVDLKDKVALDIGASTGGFTHCLLLAGAKKVFAIDSGTNQLDELLENDSRVVSLEGFNARNLTFEDLGESVNIAVADVSFISQTYIMPIANELLDKEGLYIGLIKPQFEVGKGKIGKGGIVKEKKYRHEAILKIFECGKMLGLNCLDIIESPIQGGDGNIEYLIAFTKEKIEKQIDINTFLKNKGLK